MPQKMKLQTLSITCFVFDGSLKTRIFSLSFPSHQDFLLCLANTLHKPQDVFLHRTSDPRREIFLLSWKRKGSHAHGPVNHHQNVDKRELEHGAASVSPGERQPSESCYYIKENICLSVIDILESNEIHFDVVDCVRRPRVCSLLQRTHGDDHFIVITVREMPDPSSSARYRLLDVFQDIHKCTELAVEIRPGKVDLFTARPLVGSSIGSDSDPETVGTLGGFVNLINASGNIVAECALTSEHVVRPYLKAADTKQMAQPMATCLDSYLFAANNAEEEQPIYCFSPSLSTHLEDVSHSKKQLVQLGADILAYKHSNNEEAFPQSELRQLRQQRSKIQRDTTRAIVSDRILGTVYASSGYAFSRHYHRLDWALVQVDSDRLFSARRNKVQDRSGQQLDSRQILGSLKPERNAKVYKQGCATGVTDGVVNPLQSYVATYDADGMRSVTSEWCIIPEDCNTFAGPGDSGSLVLQRDSANVMGMVFGGHVKEGKGGPAYFTSITAITTDIEKVTGWRTQLAGGKFINRSVMARPISESALEDENENEG